jgi:hypothetical protein
MDIQVKTRGSKKGIKKIHIIYLIIIAILASLLLIFWPSKEADIVYEKTKLRIRSNVSGIDSVLAKADEMSVEALLANNFMLYDTIVKLKGEIALLKRDAQQLLVKWVAVKDKPDSDKQAVLNEITAYLKRSSAHISKLDLDQIEKALNKPGFVEKDKVPPSIVQDNRLLGIIRKLNKDKDSLLSLIDQKKESFDSVLVELKRISATLDSLSKIPKTSYTKPSLYVSSYDFKPIVGRLRKEAYRRKDVNEKGFNLSFILGSTSLQKEFEKDKITVVIKYMLRGSGTDGVTPKTQEFSVKLNQPYSINISKGNFGVGSYSFAIYYGDVHSKPLCLDVFAVR